MFPDIMNDKSESEYTRQQLESTLQAAWDTIDQSQFDCLYQSMPSRIEACIKANRWHTNTRVIFGRICIIFGLKDRGKSGGFNGLIGLFIALLVVEL